MQERHVLSVLVENEPGVLSRVAGLFSGRGYNIYSLNVAPALEEGTSHMTITTFGDAQILEQLMKQLHKIVSVIKVAEYTDIPAVERVMTPLSPVTLLYTSPPSSSRGQQPSSPSSRPLAARM